MIRIALVEDEAKYRDEFLEYLKRYEKESGRHFHISVFTDGDEIATSYRSGFDLILMDIAMQFMDGMTAAQEIRKLDDEVVIIFITNTPQFVMKGYTVDALDYVLKPVSYFSFSQRIDRALKRMSRRRSRYISIPIKGGVKKLNISDIRYIEVMNHDLIYHTADESVLSRGTMAETEEHLGSSRFFRCNKCYLVNLEHIDGIEGNDVIVGGERIGVSRSKKKGLMDALNNYLSEVGK